MLRLVTVDGDRLDQPPDDVVGLEPFGLGVEVGDDPVAEHGTGHGADVFRRDVKSAVQHRAGLGRQHQILAGRGPAPQLT